MMGPVSARVPLRINLFPNSSLEEVMRFIDNEFASIIGFEHCALEVLHTNGGLQNLPPQVVFSWNPPASDNSSKRIICLDKAVAPGVLAYRDDLSVPYAHDYALLFEVYEHDGHVAMIATWDPAPLSAELIVELMENFGRFLMLILKSSKLTVREVLSDGTAGRAEETDRNSQTPAREASG